MSTKIPSLKSWEYLAKFEALDTDPLPDGDARDAQILALAKKALPAELTQRLDDEHIRRLHDDYIKGIF